MMDTVVKRLNNYVSAAEIFEWVKNEEDAVFLDSSLENGLGKYSIIGLNSYLKLTVKNDTLKIHKRSFTGKEVIEESFRKAEEYLAEYLTEHYQENKTSLPIVSGAVGYFSYDYGRGIENIDTVHQKEMDIPEIILNFYDNFIIEDLQTREVFLACNGKLEKGQDTVRQIEKKAAEKVGKSRGNKEAAKTEKENESAVRKPEDKQKIVSLQTHHPWTIINAMTENLHSPVEADFTKEEYLAAVERMKEYIVEGDIYIVNMTQRLRMKSSKSPYEVFKQLRKNNPSPFGSYMNYGSFQIVSASPERFLQLKDGIVHTRPIKGTRKRGETGKEDERLRKELEGSAKDRSELLMIVDLERNDLSRVCEKRSVQVTELFAVEAYATVFHLVSDIQGKLKEGKTAAELIRAAFPGGSITGAPKVRAMEIIDEQEHSQRGIYTGSIGYLSLDGSCDMNIVIRTALYQDGYYYLGAGGGITSESEPEFEYEETLQKAKAILEAIDS